MSHVIRCVSCERLINTYVNVRCPSCGLTIDAMEPAQRPERGA